MLSRIVATEQDIKTMIEQIILKHYSQSVLDNIEDAVEVWNQNKGKRKNPIPINANIVFTYLNNPLKSTLTELYDNGLISKTVHIAIWNQLNDSKNTQNVVRKLVSLFSQHGIDGLDDFNIEKWYQTQKKWLTTRVPYMIKETNKERLTNKSLLPYRTMM